MKNRIQLSLFLLPGLLLYGTVRISYIDGAVLFLYGLGRGIPVVCVVGLDNYKDSLSSIVFRKAFGNNVEFMLTVVIAQTFISLVLALLLFRNTKTRIVLRALYFLPAILSSVSVGLICFHV